MKNLSSSKNKLDFLRIYLKNFISLKFPFSLSSSYACAGSVCLIFIFSNFVFAEQKTAGQTINIKTKVCGDVYGNGSQPNGWEMHKLDDANNNVVNVSDDVCREWSRRDKNVNVYGASDSDKATNNSVKIHKGTISGSVYGASAGVNASNNSANIYGGNISKNVFGGKSDGNAANNQDKENQTHKQKR